MGTIEYRHEFKFICSEAQMAILQARVAGILPLDANLGNTGRSSYEIRSLYFDDYADRCLFENQSGADVRSKFRIRIYNGDRSFIRLEKKNKVRGMTQKLSSRLSEEDCLRLIRSADVTISPDTNDVLKQLLIQRMSRLMQPKIIVQYVRTPFICREGNVRITFDRNIESSSELGSFLNSGLTTRPVMAAGQHILEVKYDEYMPDYIYRSLNIENLHQAAFSKYCLCRKYTL